MFPGFKKRWGADLHLPFFGTDVETITRAIIDDKKLIHLLPPEIHGDPLEKGGILAYYNFGWDLMKQLKIIFSDVKLIFACSPLEGFSSNNHPDFLKGNMPAIEFVAIK